MTAEFDFGAHSTNPTGIGVNDTAADRNTSGQAKFSCGFLAESSNQLTCAQVFAVLDMHVRVSIYTGSAEDSLPH